MSQQPRQSQSTNASTAPQAEQADVRPTAAPLPKSVVATGWVSLLTDVATEITYPLLPTFIVGTLGASKATLGLIEGVAETTAALVRLPAGVLSDRLGRRKPLMVFGYGLAGLVRPLLGVVFAPWQALLVRFADRFGKGVRGAPRDALIAEVTTPDQRGRAFGFQRAMDHTGAAIGPLLAFAFLYFWPGEYRTLFLLTLIPGLIVLAVLWLGVKETHGEPHDYGDTATPPNSPGKYPAKSLLTTDVLHGRFVWFLAAVLLFTFGRATELMLLLQAELRGVAAVYLPLLWCVYHVAKSCLSLVGGKLGDHYNTGRMLLVGWSVHVMVYLGFAFAETAWQAVALFLIYALHFGLSEPAERILVARWAGSENRGTAFGWYYLAIGVATLPANAAFGWLWDISPWGAALPFSVAACVAILAELVLLRAIWTMKA